MVDTIMEICCEEEKGRLVARSSHPDVQQPPDLPAFNKEAANVALFLASDESSFVTGVDIKVDGGMAVW